MNPKTAECYLFGYREEGPNDPAVARAAKGVAGEADLSRRLQEQVAFDRQVSRAVHAIAAPADLRERLAKRAGQPAGGRPQFAVTAVIAAVCGLAVIVGLIVLFALDRYSHFQGRETVGRIVASANSMSGLELHAISQPAGELTDWFYMRGFDSYGVPRELSGQPAVGSRLFHFEGGSVAQVAMNCEHSPLMYIFRADQFGVDLPPGTWRQLEVEEWQAAVRRDGNVCTVLAIRGSEQEMRDLLQSLKKL